ncbi:hypothetical protein [Spiroplasma clarkii]|uniref:hypothetical protein n=1 Tax=Spiroplasma clarkii TaxID=2139 RepID=UPI000C20FDB4|nr:hypothetical protein [Spiroplasma clarkii]
MEKKKNKLFDYTPNNPNDSKRPTLKDESTKSVEVEQEAQTVTLIAKPMLKAQELISDSVDKEAKSSAQSLIARLKAQVSEKTEQPSTNNVANPFVSVDPDAENYEKKDNVVMPDPNSEICLFNRNQAYKSQSDVNEYRDVKSKMLRLQKDVRITLTPAEIQQIVDYFSYQVVKITKKEVVIKDKKYGYEFYKNNNDQKWWVVALKFEELFNPKEVRYITLWSGNTFTGYGLPTLAACLKKADDLMSYGRTGTVVWRDCVMDWNEAGFRFIAGDDPKSFTFKEYMKIVKWYESNKIRIHVKDVKVKDYEDLMTEIKAQKAAGKPVNPLASLQAKLLETPRRAINIAGYPVSDPKFSGKDATKPENKLYQIAFSLTG